MIIGLSLVLEEQSAVGDVVEVLQPLKVGDGDTAGVDVQVGDDQNVPLHEDAVGGGRGRAVGRLGDDLKGKTPVKLVTVY